MCWQKTVPKCVCQFLMRPIKQFCVHLARQNPHSRFWINKKALQVKPTKHHSCAVWREARAVALHSLWLHRNPASCRILVELPTAINFMCNLVEAASFTYFIFDTSWEESKCRTMATCNALHFRLNIRPCAFSRTAEGWRGVRCSKMARSAAQQGLGAQWQPCPSHTRATPATSWQHL